MIFEFSQIGEKWISYQAQEDPQDPVRRTRLPRRAYAERQHLDLSEGADAKATQFILAQVSGSESRKALEHGKKSAHASTRIRVREVREPAAAGHHRRHHAAAARAGREPLRRGDEGVGDATGRAVITGPLFMDPASAVLLDKEDKATSNAREVEAL